VAFYVVGIGNCSFFAWHLHSSTRTQSLAGIIDVDWIDIAITRHDSTKSHIAFAISPRDRYARD
jgi:hypothetical protein